MPAHTFQQYQKHSHRPTITAHLAQTMALLGLNNLELSEKIAGELAENPALELIEDNRCPSCNRPLAVNQLCPHCTFSSKTDEEQPVVFVSAKKDFYPPTLKSSNGIDNDEYHIQLEDLPTYVLQQISSELAVDERPIAAHILTGLNEDGLLEIPLPEIAMYHHVPLGKVEKVTGLIQRCEPIGVGCSSPKEALLVQLSVIAENQKVDPLLEEAINDHLDLFSKRNYSEIANILGVSKNKAIFLADYISENLNPFPARAHWGNIRHRSEPATNRYQIPDVIIHAQGANGSTQLIIEVLWPIRGKLKVNPQFQKAISEAPPEKSTEWNKALEQANLLIKCINQRNNTLVQLMEILAVKQRDFILHGNAYIKPLTRAKLADIIGVHESTISRAVAGKSVQLPSKQIIPISKFFDRSLHIRTALKEIISNESKPISDTKLVTLLEKQGYKIARRTVAKYRAMEGILPAHLR